MAMESNTESSRQQLLKSLQGRSLHIPDLQALLDHWPQYVNPEVGRLRQDVDDRLQSLFPEGERLRKMKAADAALFGASWWPYASFEKLRIATYLSIWLFAWDDETDSSEFSSLVSDLDGAQAFRTETIEYTKSCLTGDEHTLNAKLPSNPIIASFQPIGDAISKSCTAAQSVAFINELLFFVEMTKVEQQFQLSETLPTVEEYRQRRMGSSAVGMCLAITEYCFGMEIPPDIMAEVDMKAVWDRTNIIISTVNDILSIRKEIMQGQVDTLIPLLYLRHGTLEAAMDNAVKILDESIAAFELSSRQLLDRHSYDTDVHLGLKKFIHGCKCACTANLNWSLISGRYKLGNRALRDGILVTL